MMIYTVLHMNRESGQWNTARTSAPTEAHPPLSDDDHVGIYDISKLVPTNERQSPEPVSAEVKDVARERARQKSNSKGPLDAEKSITSVQRDAINTTTELMRGLAEALQSTEGSDQEYLERAIESVKQGRAQEVGDWLMVVNGLSPEQKGQIRGLASRLEGLRKQAMAEDAAIEGERESLQAQYDRRVMGAQARQRIAGETPARGADIVPASERTMVLETLEPPPKPWGQRIANFFGFVNKEK